MSREYHQEKWVQHQNHVLAKERQQQQMSLGLPTHIQDLSQCSVVAIQPEGLQNHDFMLSQQFEANQCLMTQQFDAVTEMLPIYDYQTVTCQTGPLYAFSTQNQPPFSPHTGQLLHIEPEQAHFPPTQQQTITSQPIDRLPCAYLERAMAQYNGQVDTSNMRLDVNEQRMCGVPLGWPSQGQTGPPSCSYDPGRLTHDSWFLSQPYHVGLPQSTHRLPDGQAAPLPPSFPSHPQANPTNSLLPPVSSFHQVVCPVHHKVFESYQLPSGQRELLTLPDHLPFEPAGCSYTVPPPIYSSPQQLEQYLPVVPVTVNHLVPGVVSIETGLKPLHGEKSANNESPSSFVDSSITMVTTTSAVSAVTTSVPWPLPPCPNVKSSTTKEVAEVTPTPWMSPAMLMNAYAAKFKQKRLEMDISPDDVARQVNIRFAMTVNPPLCGGKILLFESGSLPPAEMSRVHNYLENWLMDIERARGLSVERGDTFVKRQKKRTYIDSYQRFILEQEFAKNDRPNKHEVQEIMKRIGGNGLVTPETVRVWFCNRRTRLKGGGAGSIHDDDLEKN